MRIGYLCYSLSGAGPRVRARTLISALGDRTDHEITLVTGRETTFDHDEVEVYPVLSPDPLSALREMETTRRALGDCDVVHVPVNFYQLLYAAACGITPRVAGAGVQHEPHYRTLTRLVGVDLMIETHDQVADLWRSSGVDATYVYPAVDRTNFYPRDESTRESLRNDLGIPSDDDVVLFVGELKPLKGADLVAELPAAFDDPEVSVVVVGDGELRNRIDGRDDIVYEGFVENEALPPYYSMADLTVVPSRKESFSIVSLESIACGTPVVTTTRKNCDMYRIFHDTGVYTWADRTPDAVATAIRDLLSDPETYDEQVQRGFETIEEMGLSIEHSLEKYVAAYASVAQD